MEHKPHQTTNQQGETQPSSSTPSEPLTQIRVRTKEMDGSADCLFSSVLVKKNQKTGTVFLWKNPHVDAHSTWF